MDHIYDAGVSAIENYTRYCRRLKDEAKTLSDAVTPSKINENGRMASDYAIELMVLRIRHSIEAVEMMEKALKIGEPGMRG